jgi:hypothetical protein
LAIRRDRAYPMGSIIGAITTTITTTATEPVIGAHPGRVSILP